MSIFNKKKKIEDSEKTTDNWYFEGLAHQSHGKHRKAIKCFDNGSAVEKGICIEAIEYVTKDNPKFALSHMDSIYLQNFTLKHYVFFVHINKTQ